ncbi:recombinase RecT [Priestia megaterium]
MSNTQLKKAEKNIVDQVEERVKQLQESNSIRFPANYSPENALKSAWLILQETKTGKKTGYQPVLNYCTKNSIANALLDMVVQGLNPQKKQGYFLSYGQTLVFQRSYFGTMAVTKNVAGAKTIDAAVIYEGDTVDYEIINGRIANLKHKQQFGNLDKEILGAYCTITFGEGEVYIELMTIKEIRTAWSKSQSWNNGQEVEAKGSVHEEFTQEMAKKTVINRACKKFLNSSNDASVMMQTISHDEDEVQQEIEDNANGEVLDMDYVEVPEEQQQIIDTEKEPVAEESNEKVPAEKQSALEMDFEEEPKKNGAPF